MPVFPQWHTGIEFTHRLTSGLALVAVVMLYVWSRRVLAKDGAARSAAFYSLIFMINETLVGAMLVLLGLVAGSKSPWRAVVLAIHLVNTMLLLGSLALTAWWTTQRSGSLRHSAFGAKVKYSIWVMLLTAATGGVAALGDTLFPVQSITQGLQDDVSRSAPLLVRLRVLHPMIAAATGGYLLWLSMHLAARIKDEWVERWCNAVLWLVLAQIVLGVVNVMLLTPVWTQLSHLLLTDLLWISVVLMGAATVAANHESRGMSTPIH
jgi:heme a synthase